MQHSSAMEDLASRKQSKCIGDLINALDKVFTGKGIIYSFILHVFYQHDYFAYVSR